MIRNAMRVVTARVSCVLTGSFTSTLYHPLKCVQWPVLLGGALGRMFGGSSNFLLTFDS